jgi:pyruvate kinase
MSERSIDASAARASDEELARQLALIEDGLHRLADEHRADISEVHPVHAWDALNLIHYVALRRHDVRRLQWQLTRRGLSSLGRSEPYVLATLRATMSALRGERPVLGEGVLNFEGGRAALDTNTDRLFGPRPPSRVVRIMVTLPSEAAGDYCLVRRLVAGGMDVARINGAHDDPDAWRAMADSVRKAAAELGTECRIAMDLPGPKLRTGALEGGPQIVRLRPVRDIRGVPLTPAPLLLTAVDAAPAGSDLPVVPVEAAWLARRHPGEGVVLRDTRGSKRTMTIVDASALGVRAQVLDTTYLETGTVLSAGDDDTAVGPLPHVPRHHLLKTGDRLVVCRDTAPQPAWQHGQAGEARISCALEAVFGAVEIDDRVIFDDGLLYGVVEEVGADEFGVRIVESPPQGGRLRAEKGINLPDTRLPLPLFTEADGPLLRLAAEKADMLSLSFLRHEEDVDLIRHELHSLGADELGLVLKIETGPAFERLPEILLHAMRSERVGVMIARGDLAVEAGYERLAELQEEMLWLCEAAHVPVIWATEVLDQLARTGRPSRAEVTDAAMSQRAECVMLNKGPHIVAAIEALDDILRRMAGHQRKKIPLLRPLRSFADL